jgi:hypothetical protein
MLAFEDEAVLGPGVGRIGVAGGTVSGSGGSAEGFTRVRHAPEPSDASSPAGGRR